MHLRTGLFILLSALLPGLVQAAHLSEEEVKAMEQACEALERPVFERYRQELIAQCIASENTKRGDPDGCQRRYRDVGKQGFIIRPALPECEAARKARKYLRFK